MQVTIKKGLISGAAIFFGVVLAHAAYAMSNTPSSQEKGEAIQEKVTQTAFDAVPVPQIEHFLNREAVAEYVKRMNDPSKTFYVYLISYGKILGYYVTSTHPVSVCMLMTPAKREVGVRGSGPNPLGPAPTLDGLFGGGGAMCDHYYAMTADTGTLVEWSVDMIVQDQPLGLEADQLQK